MKKNFLTLIAVFATTLMLFTSCDKDEEILLGDLVVNVENEVKERMIEKTVYLYKGQANYDALEYSQEAVTDNSGQVKFTDLEPDTYFLEADFEILTIQYTAKGSVKVEAGLEMTVTLKP